MNTKEARELTYKKLDIVGKVTEIDKLIRGGAEFHGKVSLRVVVEEGELVASFLRDHYVKMGFHVVARCNPDSYYLDISWRYGKLEEKC